MHPDAILPFNCHNRILSTSDMNYIFGNYIPNDINIFRNAFVHRSYCTRKNENFVSGNVKCPPNCIPLQEESNERLEFLGDAVLNLIVGKYLFERFPDENEGFLTKIRTKLVNGVMLAHLASLLNLGPLIIVSKQIEESNGRNNKNILEDCLEAIIGAMFIDSKMDIQPVYDWFVNFIENNIDFSDLIISNNNYKDILIKHYQHVHGYVPKFYSVDVDVKKNCKVYHINLKDTQGNIIAIGNGNTKKIAENDCAKNALLAIGIDPTKTIN